MVKDNYFTGQPVFTQLLKLLDRSKINYLAQQGNHDKYYKSFDTHSHLVTMLYCAMNKCISSREVVSGMKACHNKLLHLGMVKAPGKSTLCDANKKRSSEVFGKIYDSLLKKYAHFLPDSRNNIKHKNLYIVDSSTISLFQEILKSPSQGKHNGQRKGGIKVHTLMSATHDVPVKINFSAAVDNDVSFLPEINLEKGAFIVFDKGYNNYSQYQRFSEQEVSFVTRQRNRTNCKILKDIPLLEESINKGVSKDQVIALGSPYYARRMKLNARLVTFNDKASGKCFEFLTNNFHLLPEHIADIYKNRWQIELFFKRIKQNFPLKYFLGDNENAIKIQIWTALIADLLIKIIQSQLKRKWSFANLRSIIRLHLMSYINLFSFLNQPDLLPSYSNASSTLLNLSIDFKT